MNIQLSCNQINHLYACRADIIGDAQIAIADTQVQIARSGGMMWHVITADADDFLMSICYRAVQAVRLKLILGDFTHELALPATKGYFDNNSLNFERFEVPHKLHLSAGMNTIVISILGKCAVSSIEIYTYAASEAFVTHSQAAHATLSPISPYAQGYGFMFHWVGQSMPRHGQPKPYADAVEAFDAEAFAQTVQNAGGRYVFFTVNHMYAHFPAPLPEWEKYFPGMTTRRDLLNDIGRALERRGIALMLYINFTAAYFPALAGRGDAEYADDAAGFENYERFAQDIFSAIGRRYGSLVKGYWVDSCYEVDRQYVNADFGEIYKASKEGYAERITTFNYWVLPTATPYLDFWAGEVDDIIALPDASEYGYGCACGLRPHALILMEDNWWHDKMDAPIAAPRFSAAQLAKFVHGMNKAGGMITINLQIFQDGGIGDATMAELKQLKLMTE